MRAMARQPRKGTMNRTERAYADHLNLLCLAGEVRRYAYEAITLRLAERTTLTPDFLVCMTDGTLELHDTKVIYRHKTRPHVEDDAAVKIKVAARQFPEFRICIAYLDPVMGWVVEEVRG